MSHDTTEATPIIVSTPVETLAHIEVTREPEAAPVVKTPTVTDLGNLFADMQSETPVTLQDTPIDTLVSTTPREDSILISEESSPLIEIATPTASVTVEAEVEEAEEVAEPLETLVSESHIIDTPTEVVASYEHPQDFVSDSIRRIDDMITRIDTAHNTKLAEALGYKTEKEKYSTLEEQAYADAEQYVVEKDHALAMRSYFVEQGSNPP